VPVACRLYSVVDCLIPGLHAKRVTEWLLLWKIGQRPRLSAEQVVSRILKAVASK
jgi:hypothetical protein